jgi:hypothetical protein
VRRGRPVASARFRAAGWVAAAVALGACSVGTGAGEVSGIVNAPDCEMNNAAYDLQPTFFGGDDAVDDQLELRVQRGSDLENKSDGLLIHIFDPAAIRLERLGQPIALTGEASSPVHMGLYLNESCPITRTSVPANYAAVSGTITFLNLYAPTVDEDDVETVAHFSAVRLIDRSAPDVRWAELSGSFRFLFNRGRPAQRFP